MKIKNTYTHRQKKNASNNVVLKKILSHKERNRKINKKKRFCKKKIIFSWKVEWLLKCYYRILYNVFRW